jgi:hypothetical protein
LPNWNFYQTNINDQISSVYLNLDAKEDCETDSFDTLVWLFIKLRIDREDGLSHDDEFDALCAYEDDIDKHVDESKTKFVGRVTTQGMRQFYFYTSDLESFKAEIDCASAKNKEYLYQTGSKKDLGWVQNDNVIYPGKYGLDQISSRIENA